MLLGPDGHPFMVAQVDVVSQRHGFSGKTAVIHRRRKGCQIFRGIDRVIVIRTPIFCGMIRPFVICRRGAHGQQRQRHDGRQQY